MGGGVKSGGRLEVFKRADLLDPLSVPAFELIIPRVSRVISTGPFLWNFKEISAFYHLAGVKYSPVMVRVHGGGTCLAFQGESFSSRLRGGREDLIPDYLC